MSAETAVKALRALVTATGVEVAEPHVYDFIEAHKSTHPHRLWRAVEHWATWRRGVPTAGALLEDDPLQAWLDVERMVDEAGAGQHAQLPLLTSLALDLCGGYRHVARRVMRSDPDVRLEFLSAYCYVAGNETVGQPQTHNTNPQGVTQAST